jgi:hypothetical protein
MSGQEVLSFQQQALHRLGHALQPNLDPYLGLQLESLDPHQNRAHVLTSDGGKVIVALKTAACDTTFMEFEGIVDAPNQLREEARCEFGGNFGETPLLSVPQPSFEPRFEPRDGVLGKLHPRLSGHCGHA